MKSFFFITFIVSSLLAHFQTVMVNKSVLEQGDNPKIILNYEFIHPFEQTLMPMEKPNEAGVFFDGKKIALHSSIRSETKNSFLTWKNEFIIKKPAVYQFYLDPKPYFEPSEGKFIRHLTKTIVDAYGAGEGWDTPIGLKAEIIPLSRPYSLYTNSIFSAQVLYKGKSVPNAMVEVEFYNTKKLKAPNDMYVTHVIKADSNGVFHVALPQAGWWGFAALIEDDEQILKEGKSYPVELGALLWLKTEEMK